MKCNSKIEKVLYDELIYVESMANYVTLYTSTGKLVVYLTIKGILENLPADRLLQVHKSYIVNIGKVKTIEGNMLHLGSTKITVGQRFLDEVMARLLRGAFIKR